LLPRRVVLVRAPARDWKFGFGRGSTWPRGPGARRSARSRLVVGAIECAHRRHRRPEVCGGWCSSGGRSIRRVLVDRSGTRKACMRAALCAVYLHCLAEIDRSDRHAMPGLAFARVTYISMCPFTVGATCRQHGTTATGAL
jgi:hypothetical protein